MKIFFTESKRTLLPFVKKKVAQIAMIGVISAISFVTSIAQQAIVAAGGDNSGNSGSVSFSVGQVSYTSINSTEGSVNQGIQQPFEIIVITETHEAMVINLECTVFPNPATDYLKLSVNMEKIEDIRDLKFNMYDINGKLLQTSRLEGAETHIDLSRFMSATYIMFVYQKEKEIKCFKIIKK